MQLRKRGSNNPSVLLHRGARTQQRSMTPHHQHQYTSKIYRQQWHCDRGHKAPHYQCMPFPLPDGVKQADGMMAEMLDLLPAEREAPSVKEVYTKLNERQKQQQV